MQRISVQIERLDATRFVLLIGLIAGTIKSIPQFFLGGVTTSPLQLLPFSIIAVTAVLWWSAAFLLWWVAVRRHQSPIWILACQVTIGLVLADLLHAGLAAVPAAIDMGGAFAGPLVRQPWTFIASNLYFSVFRVPVWLLGGVVAIAMGRSLNGTLYSHSTIPASTDPAAVT